jgi:Flp pilus assembly protein TadG
VKTFSGWARGQIGVILTLAITTLLGASALGADVAVFYYNWLQLQKAADAGALGGATYLPDNPSQAVTAAKQLLEKNGVLASEIVSTTVAGDDSSITIRVRRTVPYFFAKLLGLTNGIVTASASGAPQYPPSTVGASSPSQLPPGGDNNGNNGTYCANTGGCALIPIGLDHNTVYTDGEQITLQQGQVGPGNWDLLALGGVGGNNLRTNIADGYSGPVSVGDWVTTEPGKKVGPVDQGFQDRLTLAESVDPSGTFSSHALNNPRVLVLPVVDWEHPNGRKEVKVTAFASLWLDDPSGGKVTVHFISQVIANSFGDPNAPYFGSRGSPILLR